MSKKEESLKQVDDTESSKTHKTYKKAPKDIWETETSDEWISFSEGVPVDLVIEDPQAFEKETPWGVPVVIWVREFPRDKLVGGIRKLLKLESKRLIKGLKQASPSGVPTAGDGYIIIRSGEGFKTTYQVSYNGHFTLLKGGMREPEEDSPNT